MSSSTKKPGDSQPSLIYSQQVRYRGIQTLQYKTTHIYFISLVTSGATQSTLP